MSAEEHTPGPWSVVDGHYPCFRDIKGPSFGISIVMSATDLTFADYLQREADARLIAAAPDLLAALQLAGNSAGFQYMTFETRAAIEQAIAKATGSAA